MTVYVLTFPLRDWSSFRRGCAAELVELVIDWPSFTRGDVGVIRWVEG